MAARCRRSLRMVKALPLMRNPKLVEEILTKLVKAVKAVTVEFRKGFNDTCINAVEIAKIAESAGVAAVAVR